MPDVYNPAVAQIVWSGRLAGQLYNCVGYAVLSGEEEWSADACQNLADKGKSFWELDLAPVVSEQLAIREIRVRQMKAAPANAAVAASTVTGALESEAYANNVALCVSLTTGLAGRSYQGRIFQGGLLEGDVSDNTVSEARANAIVDAWSGWITRLSETGSLSMQPVVYSRFLNNTPRATGLFTVVSNYIVRDRTIDSMRRRLPGRGR